MNAEQAKKMSAANKKQIEENLKVRQEKVQNADVALLYTHFHSKIEESVNKGLMHTDKLSFPLDRFSNEVINDVAYKLRQEGFHLQMTKHNAFQKVEFEITW